MKKLEKYYVDYVKGCSPLKKSFNTYEEALAFALSVYMERQHWPDNWVNYIFKGNVLIEEKEDV